MIKKFYYSTSLEYYIYYTVNDGEPVIVDTSDWPEVIRNEVTSGNNGRLVLSQIPTYIPESAFYQTSHGISNLTSINIPNSVTTIGEAAFVNCDSLTSVVFPDSIVTCGDAPFEASGISTPIYNSTIFAYMPTSYSGSYTIPSGVKTIAGNSFYNCTGLTALITTSVESIGTAAFHGCTNLSTVTLSATLQQIGKNAFNLLNLGNPTFTCYATTPPTVSYDIWVGISAGTLYVPAASLSAYQNDSIWGSSFNSIQAIS